MYPHDRVLVGVITRKKDLNTAREQGWYRIPQARMVRGVHAEYLAFFLNARVAGQDEGGVYYFAERDGVELAYRKDLLPAEANHPRALEVYYKVQLRNWREKTPPVLNPTNRTITFIYSTWDRFVKATEIADLYSKNDYFVDRIFHALRNNGLQTMERSWDAQRRQNGYGAQLRILCERGSVVAATDADTGDVYLHDGAGDDTILAEIARRIAEHGGPARVNMPLD